MGGMLQDFAPQYSTLTQCVASTTRVPCLLRVARLARGARHYQGDFFDIETAGRRAQRDLLHLGLNPIEQQNESRAPAIGDVQLRALISVHIQKNPFERVCRSPRSSTMKASFRTSAACTRASLLFGAPCPEAPLPAFAAGALPGAEAPRMPAATRIFSGRAWRQPIGRQRRAWSAPR